MAQVLLYSRHGCHLCEQAAALLRLYGLDPEEIDIDGDPLLVSRYGTWVPVVIIDGKERFRGRIDEALLRRLVAGRAREES